MIYQRNYAMLFISLMSVLCAQLDGRYYFRISSDGNHLILTQPIDFNELYMKGLTSLKLNLTATDKGKPESLSSHMTLTVEVISADEKPPALVCAENSRICDVQHHQAVLRCGFRGLLMLYPEPVLETDEDVHKNFIRYFITIVEPEMSVAILEMNETTSDTRVTLPLCLSSVNEIKVTILVVEDSNIKNRSTAILHIVFLNNVTVHNLAWGSNFGTSSNLSNSSSQDGLKNDVPLDLTYLLYAILGLAAVSVALLAIVVRISKKKKSNGRITANDSMSSAYEANATTIVPGLYDETYGLCRLCSSNITAVITQFPTVPIRENANDSGTRPNYQRPRANLAPNIRHTMPGDDIIPIPCTHLQPEMKTLFTFSQTDETFHEESNTFHPCLFTPGHSKSNGLYDGSSKLGSMKHQRIEQKTGADNLIPKVVLRLTNKDSRVPGQDTEDKANIRFVKNSPSQSCA